MQQIIYFISKNSTKLLFLLLLVVSLYLTVQTHSYHESQMLHSANVVSGTICKLFVTKFKKHIIEVQRINRKNIIQISLNKLP